MIGAGSAGLAAWKSATAAGARTVLIEAGPGGTTCAATGCMPSKLLIAAANAAHRARGLGAFGLALDGAVRVVGPAVMARVRRLRDDFVASAMPSTEGVPDAELIRGRARFAGPTRLALGDGRSVAARAIGVATGARLACPEAFRAPALPFYHPTVVESLRTALHALRDDLDGRTAQSR